MDPQQMMQMLAMFMQQQRNQEHPLQRAFSGTPMFGGVPINVQPMFNLSGIGLPPNSAGGAAASMMMQSMLPQLMGPDFTPGQFNPSMNFGAFRQNMFQMQQRQAAMQQASRADAATYFT
jgi:hypothetical protein